LLVIYLFIYLFICIRRFSDIPIVLTLWQAAARKNAVMELNDLRTEYDVEIQRSETVTKAKKNFEKELEEAQEQLDIGKSK
jgi:hypothetical protein